MSSAMQSCHRCSSWIVRPDGLLACKLFVAVRVFCQHGCCRMKLLLNHVSLCGRFCSAACCTLVLDPAEGLGSVP